LGALVIFYGGHVVKFSLKVGQDAPRSRLSDLGAG